MESKCTVLRDILGIMWLTWDFQMPLKCHSPWQWNRNGYYTNKSCTVWKTLLFANISGATFPLSRIQVVLTEIEHWKLQNNEMYTEAVRTKVNVIFRMYSPIVRCFNINAILFQRIPSYPAAIYDRNKTYVLSDGMCVEKL